MKPYFETENGKLYYGDCLEILGEISAVNAVITDPPFAFTGGISNGSSANISEQFFRHWWVDICQALSSCLLPTASGFIWCDWKSAKILSDGFESKTQTYNVFRVAQMLYHFREMPGMGKPFRSSVDMIAYLRGPKHKNTSQIPVKPATLNHISEYWYYGKHNYHPAEKSQSICERLLGWCSFEGETVVDPFFGSGVVGVAAEKTGRQWIGVDWDERWCEISAKRIEQLIKDQGSMLPGF